MMRATITGSILFTLMLCACGSQKVLMYEKASSEENLKQTTNNLKDFVTVNTFVLDPVASAAQFATGLSDRGQAAYIEAVTSASKSAEELNNYLVRPFKEAISPTRTKGTLFIKKRIVINVSNNRNSNADRINDVKVSLLIPQKFRKELEFVSWEKLATEHQIVDLGKITSGSTGTLSINPSITLAGTIQGSLGGGYTKENTFAQEKAYAGKVPKLNVSLVNKFQMDMQRRAEANENISGNTVIEITFKAKYSGGEYYTYSFSGLQSAGTDVTDQSKIKIAAALNYNPSFPTAVNGSVFLDVNYTFRYRKVEEGILTIPEYDDVVKYLNGEVNEPEKLELFSSHEHQNRYWTLVLDTETVALKSPTVTDTLRFSSYEEALAFLGWLRVTRNTKVSNHDILLGLAPLTVAKINNLKVNYFEGK